MWLHTFFNCGKQSSLMCSIRRAGGQWRGVLFCDHVSSSSEIDLKSACARVDSATKTLRRSDKRSTILKLIYNETLLCGGSPFAILSIACIYSSGRPYYDLWSRLRLPPNIFLFLAPSFLKHVLFNAHLQIINRQMWSPVALILVQPGFTKYLSVYRSGLLLQTYISGIIN